MAVTAAPTWQDVRDLFEASASADRPALSFATGTLPDMFAGGVASVADRIIAYAALKLRDTYLDGAEGAELTTLANDHWGVQRSPGAYATIVAFEVTRATANGNAGGIAIGDQFATQVDALGRSFVFVATTAASWTGAETGMKTVDLRAASIGLDYNVAADTVTRVLSTLWDTVTVNNTAAAAGGANEDSDAELRERVRGQSLAWRRGTLAALEYIARQVSGVATATAVEDSTGLVAVYVADADGNSNSSMALDVSEALEADGAAAGAAWFVQGGTLTEEPITIAITARTGVDTAALVTAITAAIEARVNKLKHGETLYRDMIQQAARNAGGDAILSVTVTLPATDVEPAANEIIKAGVVTVS